MKLLTKESLPFEFVLKETKSENNCIISFNNENVIITINDQIFSFSTNESEFENSIFSYKTKYLNYIDHNTYVINQFTKTETVNGLKSNYIVSTIKIKYIWNLLLWT